MTDVKDLPIEWITVERNDRTTFDPIQLQALADSIREHGLANPITVREVQLPHGGGQYVLVAGERRLRAHKLLGLKTIKTIVLTLTDEQAAELMLSENVSRSDLDPIDEGLAYQIRIEKYGWTPLVCAQKAGVSVTRVNNRIKLLALRTDLQDLVRTGNLELGYARMIAESGLDTNFQTLAFRALRDNPNPSIAWFRRTVGDLVNKAASARLIEDPLFSGHAIELPAVPIQTQLPPTPSTFRPALKAPSEHITFWREAAAAWDHLGKNFKRDECLAAVAALTYVCPTTGG